jgi:hypothetical protein
VSFTPEFMKAFDVFDRERRAIRTLEDWRAFQKRWFDHTNWPKKSKELITKEGIQKAKRPKVINGRRWSTTYFSYDLTPEARYEYCWTLTVIGAPLQSPNWNTAPRTVENGWRQECGYCEISTGSLGDDTCPQCGRPMYYAWYSD